MSKWLPRMATRWFHVSPAEFRLTSLVFALFLTGALVYLWPNVKIVNLAYKYQKQKRIHRDLVRENILLKLERDSLQSLDRVQFLAESKLGMIPPDSGQVVTIFLK